MVGGPVIYFVHAYLSRTVSARRVRAPYWVMRVTLLLTVKKCPRILTKLGEPRRDQFIASAVRSLSSTADAMNWSLRNVDNRTR